MISGECDEYTACLEELLVSMNFDYWQRMTEIRSTSQMEKGAAGTLHNSNPPLQSVAVSSPPFQFSYPLRFLIAASVYYTLTHVSRWLLLRHAAYLWAGSFAAFNNITALQTTDYDAVALPWFS